MTALAASRNPHTPVLRDEVLHALAPQNSEIFVDGTFGAGGYTRALLDAVDCQVYAIDRDPDAVRAGYNLAQTTAGRLTMLEGRFGQMEELLAAEGVCVVNGITLDIGVSSMQLDQAQRGFSFLRDGPLDMRMSQSGETAADIVNNYSEENLATIFREYGEERHAGLLARAICQDRPSNPFVTTRQLASLAERVLSFTQKKGASNIHPATRIFQALRIYLNDELGELDKALDAALKLLAPDGRLAIVSFHSLEDRKVKAFFLKYSGGVPKGSRHLPDVASDVPTPLLKLKKRGAIKSGDAEIAANPRARSARLRVALRTDAPFTAPITKGGSA